MKKIEEKSMSKWTAGGLLGATLFLFLSVGCEYVSGSSANEKHLGPVTVRSINSNSDSIEFLRANGEFFETKFMPGWNAPSLRAGDALKDVIYTDGKNGESVFIKAVLDHEAQLGDDILYSARYHAGGIYCSNNTCQQYEESGRKFYRWSDGGYREKPEPKKK